VKTSLRRKWLIYPKFQLMMIFTNLLMTFFAGIFVTYEIYLTYEEQRTSIRRAGFLPGHEYYTGLNSQLTSALWHVVFALTLSSVISALVSLVVSNRLVGPIYRLQEYLKKFLKDGAQSPLAFRKNDYFEQLPGLVNAALEKSKKS
jgi:sensor histidine kinase YesM